MYNLLSILIETMVETAADLGKSDKGDDRVRGFALGKRVQGIENWPQGSPGQLAWIERANKEGIELGEVIGEVIDEAFADLCFDEGELFGSLRMGIPTNAERFRRTTEVPDGLIYTPFDDDEVPF